jgi:hypothetical protein
MPAFHPIRARGLILWETILGLSVLMALITTLTLALGQSARIRQRLSEQRQQQRVVEQWLIALSAGDASAAAQLRQGGYALRVIDSDDPARVWVAVAVPGIGDDRELFALVPRGDWEIQP